MRYQTIDDAVWCPVHQRTELLTNLCVVAAAGPGLYDGVVEHLYIACRDDKQTSAT